MPRLISLIDRRPDLDLAAFSEHWRTTHRELALALVPVGLMRGYVQNHRLPVEIPGLAAPADGAPELWVDSMDAMARLATTPAYTEHAALDEPNFMAGGARGFVGDAFERTGSAARETLAHATKLMLFYDLQPGISRAAALDEWRRDALTLSGAPGVSRGEFYIAAPAGAGSPESCIEAIWWSSRADFDRAWHDRGTCLSSTIDRMSLKGMLVEELPVLWPEDPGFSRE